MSDASFQNKPVKPDQTKPNKSADDPDGMSVQAHVSGFKGVTSLPQQPLKPGNILQLQRLIGNRAVTKKLQSRRTASHKPFLVQRALMDVATFNAGNLNNEPGILPPKIMALAGFTAAIPPALANYNMVPPADPAQYQNRFRLLRQLERAIYAWFNALETTDFDNVPAVPHMMTLMRQVEDEHKNLVATVTATADLPVDTSILSPVEINAVTLLWNSIKSNAGMLKITDGGDAAFKTETLAAIAKMLQTPTGRSVLSVLNAPGPVGATPTGINPTDLPVGTTGYETIITSSTLEKHGGHLIPVPGGDSANRPIAQVLNNPGGGENYTQIGTGPMPPVGHLAADYPRVNNAVELNQQITDGRSGFHVDDAGTIKWYKFGGGQGSSTVVRFNQNARSLGQHDTEIITPKFLLLAHELGHALRIRGGAYAEDDMFGWFHEIGNRWQNKGEEMVNVIGVENPIRNESGVSTRTTYDTWKVRYGIPAINALVVSLQPELHKITNAGFTEENIMAFARPHDNLRQLLLVGTLMVLDGTTEGERIERQQLKDGVSRPLIDRLNLARPLLYNQFMTSKLHLLNGYLTRLGSDSTVANLNATLTTVNNRIAALAYLHRNRNRLPAIKDLLSFSFISRNKLQKQQQLFTFLIADVNRTIDQGKAHKKTID